MVEAQDLEDVADGLVEVGQAEVAAVAPDLLDGSHECAQARAGDVGQARAADHDLEVALRQRLLDLPLELADGVGVDEAPGVEERHPLDVARLHGQLAHRRGQGCGMGRL